MAYAQASIGSMAYRTDIRAGTHALVADEGPALGGGDAGPAPYDLLLASLGACTTITLKMYAERKGWPLTGVQARLRFIRGDDGQRIERGLVLEGDLDDAQRARLADIAERTPVTLTLKGGLPIHTSLIAA